MILTRLFEHDEEHEHLHDARHGDLGVGVFGKRDAARWDEKRQTQTDTICPYCGVGCNLTLHVQDNEIVKVTSPDDHDITRGNLCIKGRFGYDYVKSPRRG